MFILEFNLVKYLNLKMNNGISMFIFLSMINQIIPPLLHVFTIMTPQLFPIINKTCAIIIQRSAKVKV